MNKKKKILALIVVAIAGALAYWKKDILMQKFGLIKGSIKRNDNKNTVSQQNTSAPRPSSTGIIYKECDGFPLKIGCKGKLVRGIQVGLNKNFNAKLETDGIFGKLTEAALEKAGFGKTLEYTEVKKLVNGS